MKPRRGVALRRWLRNHKHREETPAEVEAWETYWRLNGERSKLIAQVVDRLPAAWRAIIYDGDVPALMARHGGEYEKLAASDRQLALLLMFLAKAEHAATAAGHHARELSKAAYRA